MRIYVVIHIIYVYIYVVYVCLCVCEIYEIYLPRNLSNCVLRYLYMLLFGIFVFTHTYICTYVPIYVAMCCYVIQIYITQRQRR